MPTSTTGRYNASKALLQLEITTTTSTEECEGCGARMLRFTRDWCSLCVCLCVCVCSAPSSSFYSVRGMLDAPFFIHLLHSWSPEYPVAWHALCAAEVPQCLHNQVLHDSDARLVFLFRLRTLSRLRILSRLRTLSGQKILSWLRERLLVAW